MQIGSERSNVSGMISIQLILAVVMMMVETRQDRMRLMMELRWISIRVKWCRLEEEVCR